MIGKSMRSDDNFGSVLHRRHTTVNSSGYGNPIEVRSGALRGCRWAWVSHERANNASGSLATFTSRTILPASFTMQMLVSLTETSSPAKWSMLRFSF